METDVKQKNDDLKRRNLDIINCIKKHMQKPVKYRDLYFVPKYEKAMILFAVERLEKFWKETDSENTVQKLNKSFYDKLQEVNEQQENKSNAPDDYLVFKNPYNGKKFVVSYSFESKNGAVPVEESQYVFRGTRKECFSYIKETRDETE